MTLTEKEKNKIEEEEKYRAQVKSKYSPVLDSKTSRNRIAAALLAIFLGSFGIHKFYLGKPVQGFIYLIFCWTFLPGLIGFIEGIIYLLMSDKSFENKYA
ncbi:MAG: TM2 domain-containing protein [Candidatus Daviesbacteria bacterium]|nr:TM2 domain-containing protein [Candidatus Daviesbacteria bacterium]